MHLQALFKELTKQTLLPKRTMAILLPRLYKLMGKKRLYPLIAKGEYRAVKSYEPVAEKFSQVKSIKSDEQRHGDTVLALLKK